MKLSELIADPRYEERDAEGRAALLTQYWDKVKEARPDQAAKTDVLRNISLQGAESGYLAKHAPAGPVKDFYAANAEAVSLIYNRARKEDPSSPEFQATLKDYGQFYKRSAKGLQEAVQTDQDLDRIAENVLGAREILANREVLQKGASVFKKGEMDKAYESAKSAEETGLQAIRDTLLSKKGAIQLGEEEAFVERVQMGTGRFKEPFKVGDNLDLYAGVNSYMLPKEDATKLARESGAARASVDHYVKNFEKNREAYVEPLLKSINLSGLNDELQKEKGDTDAEKAVTLIKKLRDDVFRTGLSISLNEVGEDINRIPILGRFTEKLMDPEKLEERKEFLSIIEQYGKDQFDEGFFRQLRGAVGSTLPSLAVSAVGATTGAGIATRVGAGAKATSSAALAGAAVLPSIPQGTRAFASAREAGEGVLDSARIGVMAFLSEAAPTMLFGRTGVERAFVPGMTTEVVKKGLAPMAARFAKQTGMEIAEEELSTIAGIVTSELELNPNMTVDEVWEATKDTALAAGVLGMFGAAKQAKLLDKAYDSLRDQELGEAAQALRDNWGALQAKAAAEAKAARKAAPAAAPEAAPEPAPAAPAGAFPVEPSAEPLAEAEAAPVGADNVVVAELEGGLRIVRPKTQEEKAAEAAPVAPAPAAPPVAEAAPATAEAAPEVEPAPAEGVEPAVEPATPAAAAPATAPEVAAAQEAAPQLTRDTAKPEQMTPEEAGITPSEPALYPPRSATKRFGPLGYDSPSATPELIAKHKAELKEYRASQKRAKDRTEKSNKYWYAIEAAVKEGRPISASAMDFRYRGNAPAGYVRQGELYVYQPTPQPNEAQTQEDAAQEDAQAEDAQPPGEARQEEAAGGGVLASEERAASVDPTTAPTDELRAAADDMVSNAESVAHQIHPEFKGRLNGEAILSPQEAGRVAALRDIAVLKEWVLEARTPEARADALKLLNAAFERFKKGEFRMKGHKYSIRNSDSPVFHKDSAKDYELDTEGYHRVGDYWVYGPAPEPEAATPNGQSKGQVAPAPYSKAALKEAFGLTDEVAEATDAIVKATGLDESKIRVARGGVPGSGALRQGGIDPAKLARHAELEAKHNAGTITPEERAEAKRIVVEAAKAAGYDVEGWHGTADNFVSFDLDHPNRKDTGWLGRGVYLTTNRDLARSYSLLKRGSGDPKVLSLFARLRKPYIATLRDKQRLQLISNRDGDAAGRDAAVKWTRELTEKGHDGVILDFEESQVGKANASKEIVIFDPAGVKSAEPFTGVPLAQRFDAASPSILYQSASLPDFYSQLERVIEQKVQGKSATPQQVMAIANAGAKAEEVKWSGLAVAVERLAAENGGKVPKAALLEYLRTEGATRFEEVTLGAHSSKTVAARDEGSQRMFGRRYAELSTDEKQEVDGMLAEADDPELETATSHSQYQLPGGENYREVVLALPEKGEVKIVAHPSGRGFALQHPSGRYEGGGLNPTRWDSMTAAETGLTFYPPSDYTSTHFPDIPNYVAHMRTNERADSQGKDGLFIEEIQSDRHQAGRKKGYREDGAPLPDNPARYEDIVVGDDIRGWGSVRSIRQGDGGLEFDIGSMWITPSNFQLDRVVGRNERHTQETSLNNRGIPDAPHRKDWPLAMFKRALRDAVASGHKWIGWTPGQVHTDRWGTERIDWAKQPDGSFLVRGKQQEGGVAGGIDLETEADSRALNKKTDATVRSQKELRDAIAPILTEGQDADGLSEKLWARMQAEPTGVSKPRKEGFEGFYDTMLPKEVGKYVKQWGAKVVKGEVSLKEAKAVKDSIGMFYIEGVDGRHLTASYPTEAEAFEAHDRSAKEIGAGASTDTAPIWRIYITPQMIESLAKGQPLFQGEKGAAELFEDGSAIIRALANPDASTGIHEIAHTIRHQLLNRNAPADQRAGITDEDIAVAEAWAGAKDGVWNRAAEEKFARGVERYLYDGKAPTKALQDVFAKFAKWMSDIYQRLKNSPIDIEISPEMRRVLDRVFTRGERISQQAKKNEPAPASPELPEAPATEPATEPAAEPAPEAEVQAVRPEEEAPLSSGDEQQAVDEAAKEQDREELNTGAVNLPPEAATVTEMLADGKTLDEIAAILGKTLEQVRAILNRTAKAMTDGTSSDALALLMEDAGGVTSTMNAVMRAEREARGVPPVLTDAQQAHPELLERADARLAADPLAASKVIDGLVSGEKTAVDEVDEALLLYEKVRLMNARRRASERASNLALSQSSRDDATKQVEDIEVQLERVDRATYKSGQTWGRLGRFRQTLMRQDFSTEEMERTLRVAKQGPLTPEELQIIQDLSDQMQALQDKLEARKEEASEEAADAAFDDTMRSLSKEALGNLDPKIVAIAEKISERLSKAADAARDRLKEKMGGSRASAGIDPTILWDLSVIGADYLARGVRDFTKWSAAMILDVKGLITKEDLDPYLKEIYEGSEKAFEQQLDTAPKKVRAEAKKIVTAEDAQAEQDRLSGRIKERLDDGEDLNSLRVMVQKLALNLVRSGVRGRDNLLDRVHAVLQEHIPGITKEDTRDTISGYGDVKKLDNEEAKRLLREYKGEMQQIGKIEDMLAGRAPKASGPQRRVQAAEERRLLKIVNDLKRRGKYRAPDTEAQLKTAFDGLKSRLNNEIDDIDHAIFTKERLLEKKSKVDLKPEQVKELERLRALRDSLKKDYNAIFPKTPPTEEEQIEKAAAALDRIIERLQKDLKEGKLYGEPRKAPLNSPALEARRAIIDDLRAQRDHLRDLDVEMVNFRKERALLKRIEEAKKGPKPPRSKEHAAETQRITELGNELNDILKATRESPESRIKRALDATDRSILKVEKELEAGVVDTPAGREAVHSPELDAKRAYLSELRMRRDEIKALDAVRNNRIKAARLKKSIEKILDPKAVRRMPETEDSPEVTALRERLKTLQDERRNDPARRLRQWKATQTRRIADLKSKIASGDVMPKPRKPIELDDEGKKLASDVLDVKKKFLKIRHAEELKRRTTAKKAWDSALQVSTTARAIKTSFDLSAPGRQGILLGAAHPKAAVQAFVAQLQAAFSRSTYEAIHRDIIHNRKNSSLYKEAKLYIADPETYSLSEMEEQYMSRWVQWIEKNVPGIGKLIAGSQRAYITYLNVLRANSFDAIMSSVAGRHGSISGDEGIKIARDIADYVNIATGRGNLGGASNSAIQLNAAFFAPRLVVSRFEYLLGKPLMTARSKEARKMIAREYVKTALGIMTLAGLGLLAGAEIDDEPTSTDFLKLKFGNTRVDIFGGLMQAWVLIARAKTGKTTSPVTGKTTIIRGDEAGFSAKGVFYVGADFVRSKLNPALAGIVNALAGKNLLGERATIGGEMLDWWKPMIWDDMVESFEEQGLGKGTFFSLLAILGLGIQNINPEKIKEERKVAERERQARLRAKRIKEFEKSQK